MPDPEDGDWTEVSNKLPKEGAEVWAVTPWNSVHRAVFGRSERRPKWYSIDGRTNTLPAVKKWKYDE